MKDQIQFETNGLTVLAHRVPDNSYDHRIVWSDTDDRFSIDYHFSANHRGGFILWYKDFGGKKKYPKRGQVHIHAITTDMTEEQAKVLAQRSDRHPEHELYEDAMEESTRWAYLLKDPVYALRQILRSHGIDPDEKYVLLIKEI